MEQLDFINMNSNFGIHFERLSDLKTCGAGPAYHPVLYEFTPVYCNVCVARPSVFCVMFCRSLFVLLSIVFWQLYCLSFKFRLQTFLVDNHQEQLRRERFKRHTTQRVYKANLIIVSLIINLFSPWNHWKIVEVALNNTHSFGHCVVCPSFYGFWMFF
jgi:hypothetical protein